MKKATYLFLCFCVFSFAAKGYGVSDSLHFFTKHEEVFYKGVLSGNSSQLFNLYMSIDTDLFCRYFFTRPFSSLPASVSEPAEPVLRKLSQEIRHVRVKITMQKFLFTE